MHSLITNLKQSNIKIVSHKTGMSVSSDKLSQNSFILSFTHTTRFIQLKALRTNQDIFTRGKFGFPSSYCGSGSKSTVKYLSDLQYNKIKVSCIVHKELKKNVKDKS